MKHILARIAKSQIEEEDGNTPMVGTQFSKETRVRDEDEEMKKFIEAEMEKRRGKNLNMEYKAGSEQNTSSKYMSPEEAALAELPEHLKAATGKKVNTNTICHYSILEGALFQKYMFKNPENYTFD